MMIVVVVEWTLMIFPLIYSVFDEGTQLCLHLQEEKYQILESEHE